MTQFADLVTKAWAHAKCPQAPLYLAGYEGEPGERSALLSDEPKAYSESFILRAEELTGCTFERVPVDAFQALWLEYDYYLAAYARVENKNHWTDNDRRWHRELATKVSELRSALREHCPSEPHEVVA
jgi:hypothetical protein